MKQAPDPQELLERGVAQVVDQKNLGRRLQAGHKLTVKLGIDPTGSELTLGHSVVLRKLRDFARAGHRVVLIIGDFTGQVGDPSGRESDRKPLTSQEVEAHMADWLDQVRPILGESGTDFTVRHNSEWLGELGSAGMMELMKTATWQQLSQRSDFKKRIEAGEPLSFLEMFYPLLQGYDSVAVESDLELGGTDQTFNLLMGRQVQERYGQKPQDILTLELLVGTDGQKMGKSLENFIALRTPSSEMYGQLMRISDPMIERYLVLCTDLSQDEIKDLAKEPPRDQKARLAREVVALYHGEEAAQQAEREFGNVFRDGGTPDEVGEYVLETTKNIVEVLEAAGLVQSKSEARRLIDQGGVRVDGDVVTSYELEISGTPAGRLLQVGKRRFVRIKSPS